MLIWAKYDGSCLKCHKLIRKGMKVDWIKGKGVLHYGCSELVAYIPDGIDLGFSGFKRKKS